MAKQQAVRNTPVEVARRHFAAREEARAQRRVRLQTAAIAVVSGVFFFTLWTSASQREKDAFAAVEATESTQEPRMGLRALALKLATRSGDELMCIEQGLDGCN